MYLFPSLNTAKSLESPVLRGHSLDIADIWEKGRSLKQIHSTNSDRKQLTWGTHSIGDDRWHSGLSTHSNSKPFFDFDGFIIFVILFDRFLLHFDVNQ